VDGRAPLLDEVQSAPADLRAFVSNRIRSLIAEPRFLDALPGYLLPDQANQARIWNLTEKLNRLGKLG
jgi:hypothetical protein